MEALGLTEAMLWEAEYASLNLTFNLHRRLIKLFSAPLRWRSPQLVANLISITFTLFSPIIPSLISLTLVPAAIAQTSNCNTVFLEKGDRGAAVTALQQDLRRGGYPNISVDSIFGRQTDDILRRFQASSNLTADGIYGPITCRALSGKIAGITSPSTSASILPTPPSNLLPPARSQGLSSLNTSSSSVVVASSGTSRFNNLAIAGLLRNGSRGSEVIELQTALQRLGYRVSADGVFGAQTESAVRDFQSRRGISVDGVVGPNTVRELNIALGDGDRFASGNAARYIVVVPSHSRETLAIVRQYVPEAQEFSSRRGTFVQAGQSDNRDAAESISSYLRSRNLDARVFAP